MVKNFFSFSSFSFKCNSLFVVILILCTSFVKAQQPLSDSIPLKGSKKATSSDSILSVPKRKQIVFVAKGTTISGFSEYSNIEVKYIEKTTSTKTKTNSKKTKDKKPTKQKIINTAKEFSFNNFIIQKSKIDKTASINLMKECAVQITLLAIKKKSNQPAIIIKKADNYLCYTSVLLSYSSYATSLYFKTYSIHSHRMRPPPSC